MSDVKLDLDEKGKGSFYIEEDGIKVGEMHVSVYGGQLTVYHTEVLPEAEGKGLSKLLLQAMTAYVREHNMKVIALCPYVLVQFRRHPDQYEDIWIK